VLTNTETVFFSDEEPRSRRYGRTGALRLLVQPCGEDEDEDKDEDYFSSFSKQWSTGGMKLTGENRSTGGKTRDSAV
jgi:hypothetical protein